VKYQDSTDQGLVRHMVWALRWVAAEPEAALAPLRGTDGAWIMSPDEIAITLEDWWLPLKARDVLAPEVKDAISEIDAAFNAMSGRNQPDDWTPEAVRSSQDWAAQRKRARDVLALLGEPRADDDLSGHV
jgi:hypothetical protein